MLSSLGRIAVSLNRRLALACTATKMITNACVCHRKHPEPWKKTRRAVCLDTLARFSVIYYQASSPPDSFNLINKPDQTKATCHNNHCPSTFRHGLGRNTVSVGLRLFFGKNT